MDIHAFIAGLKEQPLASAQRPEDKKLRARMLRLATVYNMSVADYEHLLAKQGGVCAVCYNAETAKGADGRPKMLVVDHCHATGMVRGLLCGKCNTLLGAARDNTATLKNAVQYLETSRKKYEEASPAELERARMRPALWK